VPSGIQVTVVTTAELTLGTLMAVDADTRATRLATLAHVKANFEPLPIDEPAADAWARLVAQLRGRGRRAPVNDTWIAAIALARGLPVVTQDDGYDDMPGVEVIRV